MLPSGLSAIDSPVSSLPTALNLPTTLPPVMLIWSTSPLRSRAYRVVCAMSGTTETASDGIGTVPRTWPLREPTMVTLAVVAVPVST